MRSTTGFGQYAVISPVRDEERHIELTIQSVIAQTSRPAQWVIVDDESRDRTADIVHQYSMRHPFIHLTHLRREGERHPGSRVIHAFNHGLPLLAGSAPDFIVKLDCDLSFGPRYFETLLERFAADDRLGIASGVYLEECRGGRWQLVEMPSYHAFGACKVVRRRCFQEIGGFVTLPGWDTVDEIRAWEAGWTTRHFADLETRHHKAEGSGIGCLRTSRMHGEIFYATGGDPLFFVFKALRRGARRPFLLAGLALAWGYVDALVHAKPRLVTPSQGRVYKRLLRDRLLRRAARPGLAALRTSP